LAITPARWRKLTKYEKLRMFYYGNYEAYTKVMKQQIAYLLKLLMIEKGFNKQDAKRICHAVISPHWYPRDSESMTGHTGYYETGPCHYQNEWLRGATQEQIRNRFIPKVIRRGERLLTSC